MMRQEVGGLLFVVNNGLVEKVNEQTRENSIRIRLLCESFHKPQSVCKLPHDVALSDKAPLWSPVVFLAKFAPIVGSGHQYSMADAVAFLYPRHARLERDLANWWAKEVFEKL
ncbi:uncharacterized protein TNCV_2842721 [Trichonephila clavipes]|nr:uncharacterized protein TNCV_2842721 [Trichonephila clavipes]